MSAFHSHFMVIGTGVAGLKTALEATRYGTVNVITKKQDFESNTNYAQGGIASVLDQNDTFDSHVQDTLKAGANLCHRKSVELIVTNGPEAIEELISIGVDFTRDGEGTLELGREGGHTRRRIVHSKDLTGREVEKSLLAEVKNHPKIDVYEFHYAVDLIQDDSGRCWGAWVWDEREKVIIQFLAGVTILSTGGCGLVYRHTTNPPIATADGVAMAFRAGANVANMEFIQFHPTAFHAEEEERPFLISEAVRGEGAIIRAGNGDAFMEKYHELKDLAPRDIVARAIDNEMIERGEPCCFLDVSHIDQDFFHDRFPFISNYCEEHGVDLAKSMIPIVPAAHYSCGGVQTDLSAATNIEGLFCVGESACTGVHGANRLASNSILEALVFSKRSIMKAVELGYPDQKPSGLDETWRDQFSSKKLEAIRLVNCRRTLQELMWDYVGIVRSNDRLEKAVKRLDVLKEEIDSYVKEGYIDTPLLELRNLALAAELIIHCAIQRKESRGLHFTVDYPDLSDRLEDSIIADDGQGGFHIENVPIPE